MAVGYVSSTGNVGMGSGSGEGSGSGIGWGCGMGSGSRASTGCTGSSEYNAISQPQQSLQQPHFSQRWFPQVSFVQFTQIRVDVSSQMLQEKGMGFILNYQGRDVLGVAAGSRERVARHRCASWSATRNSCSF
jgi:hypothetical protein